MSLKFIVFDIKSKIITIFTKKVTFWFGNNCYIYIRGKRMDGEFSLKCITDNIGKEIQLENAMK